MVFSRFVGGSMELDSLWLFPSRHSKKFFLYLFSFPGKKKILLTHPDTFEKKKLKYKIKNIYSTGINTTYYLFVLAAARCFFRTIYLKSIQ